MPPLRGFHWQQAEQAARAEIPNPHGRKIRDAIEVGLRRSCASIWRGTKRKSYFIRFGKEDPIYTLAVVALSSTTATANDGCAEHDRGEQRAAGPAATARDTAAR